MATRAPTIRLQKDLARSLRQGHPWIYRDALRDPPRLADGTLVAIQTKDGRPLVWGFWTADSPLAVRVLEPARIDDPAGLVRGRLETALARRLERLELARTNTFRWVHGEGDRLPGIHIDVYDDVAAVRYDGAGARAFYAGLDEALPSVGARAGIRTVVDREHRSDVAPREVRENGLLFAVDLARGQKGGLFLDQRENRAEVGRRARGKSVLNLFGYTGGFSLYAAAGGATRTDTVDAAAPALAAARRNFERNHFDLSKAAFHTGDAFAFLEDARRRKQTWDIVISDPPSFAPSKKALPAARTAYRRLHALAAAVVAPGGLFCPASCSSHFDREEFLASVKEGVSRTGRRWKLEELRRAGFDHPVLPVFPEGDYLKFALGTVES